MARAGSYFVRDNRLRWREEDAKLGRTFPVLRLRLYFDPLRDGAFLEATIHAISLWLCDSRGSM